MNQNNNNYFDILPIELKYIIILRLNHQSLKNTDHIIFDLKSINYQQILKSRYPILYSHVKYVIDNDNDNDCGKKFYRYSNEQIYKITYNTMNFSNGTNYRFRLDSEFKDFAYTDIVSSIADSNLRLLIYMSNIYPDPLIDPLKKMAKHIELKLRYPILYQKLKYFESIECPVDDPAVILCKLGNKLSDNKTDGKIIYDYLLSGILSSELILKDSLGLGGDFVILLYILINDYLNGSIKLKVYNDIYEDFQNLRIHYPYSYLNDISEFIRKNKSKLEYYNV